MKILVVCVHQPRDLQTKKYSIALQNLIIITDSKPRLNKKRFNTFFIILKYGYDYYDCSVNNY